MNEKENGQGGYKNTRQKTAKNDFLRNKTSDENS